MVQVENQRPLVGRDQTCYGPEHTGLAASRGAHNEQGVARLQGHAQVAAQLQRVGRCEHVERPQREAGLPPLGAHYPGRR